MRLSRAFSAPHIAEFCYFLAVHADGVTIFVRGLLVRVGIDSTDDGHWNGPADSASGAFVYIPIAESNPLRPGFERF